MARDPAFDQILYVDPIRVSASLDGLWANINIVADPIVVAPVVSTTLISGIMMTDDDQTATIVVSVSLRTVTEGVTEMHGTNLVWWSNIGDASFTIDRKNVAGRRYMDWGGWIYSIKKLGEKVVVYGQNGISMMIPAGVAWGLKTISRIGLKGRKAVAGDDVRHFFVDRAGDLWSMTDGIAKLGYKEFIAPMSSLVALSMDVMNTLLYICDGATGYVYNYKDGSFAEGPANITGIGYKNGVMFVAAPAAVSIPLFEMTTDICDLGSRKSKTISTLEIGTDETSDVWAAIDYRLKKEVAFATTPWVKVNPSGIAVLPCFGVEFRFRLKMLVATSFDLDYIRVNGVIHNYSYLDSFTRMGN